MCASSIFPHHFQAAAPLSLHCSVSASVIGVCPLRTRSTQKDGVPRSRTAALSLQRLHFNSSELNPKTHTVTLKQTNSVLPPPQPCTKDEECCDDQLCVWGQCSGNATRGEAGSTCWRQSDCSPDLCCAFHTGTVQRCLFYLSRNRRAALGKQIGASRLCLQSCSSPFARPSLSSASAASGPPTR